MGLRLLLLRHAKSSHGHADQIDFGRPLAGRGRRDASEMAARMRGQGLIPQRIICSSALRTKQTLLRTLPELLPAMPRNAEILFRQVLYEGGSKDYLGAIRTLGDDASPLMLLGHNPSIHECAMALTGKTNSALEEGFPTSALAVIDFDIAGWSALTPRTGRFVDLLTPGTV